MIADHVAHETDEDEVHRVLETLADRQHPRVVLAVEVAEGVESAAREEGFGRARGIPALERGLQHGLERAVGPAGAGEILHGPGPQVVLRVNLRSEEHTSEL